MKTLIPIAGMLILVTTSSAVDHCLPQSTLPRRLPQVTLPDHLDSAGDTDWTAPRSGDSCWRYDPVGGRWWWYSRDERCWYRVAQSAPPPQFYQTNPASYLAPPQQGASFGRGAGGC